MKVASYIRVAIEGQAKEGYSYRCAYVKLSMGIGFLEVEREYIESFSNRDISV